MITNETCDELIGLCQNLIRCKSYSGHEDKVAQELKKYFEKYSFDEIIIDDFGNIIGCIKGKRPGKKILFDGHIDTVPVENVKDWDFDPFGAEIHDNKIYGRGTSDMKGAVSSMACAAANFAKKCNKDFAGEIYISGVVHEECFEGVAARSISKKVNPDYVIIGEASNLNIKIGQRGRVEINVEVFGKAAHSANPEKGINSVYKMTKIIDNIRKLEPTHDDVLGDGIIELTDIKSSPYPGASVVPEYCKATYDRRLLVGETKESVLKPLIELIENMQKSDSELKAKVSYAVGTEKCYTGSEISSERFYPGWKYSKDEDYINKVKSEFEKIGQTPEITQYNFCTNGSHYAGEANIKTLGYGPSKENLAHTVNEYIEIDQLIKSCEGYQSIISALLKEGDTK